MSGNGDRQWRTHPWVSKEEVPPLMFIRNEVSTRTYQRRVSAPATHTQPLRSGSAPQRRVSSPKQRIDREGRISVWVWNFQAYI